MTEPSPRELTQAERAYVADVEFALRGLPRAVRGSLLEATRQNLAERPPCKSQTELARELHPPRVYAAELQEDLDRSEPGSVARARRRHRMAWTATALAVVVLVVGGTLGIRWWVTWDPAFYSQMSSWTCLESDGSACPAGAVTKVDNVLGTTTRVRCMPGRTPTIAVSIQSHSAVTLTGAEIDPFDQLYTVRSIQPWVQPPGQHPAPSRWPVTVTQDGTLTLLYITLDLDCQGAHTGQMIASILTIRVHLRAYGLDRTADFDLPRPIEIAWGDA